MPTAFNGLHVSDDTSKTWRTLLPKKVVPRLMELGFELNTTIFVASEVPESLKVLMEMMEGMVSDGTPVSFVFGDHSRYIVMLF